VLKDKAGFVASASAAIASCLSKPETYVAVCVTDDHRGMSFGGTTDPTALGCVYSIGSINQDNNGALTAALSELLEEHGGVPNDRIYINFFDVPRANCGWSGRTFAGWPVTVGKLLMAVVEEHGSWRTMQYNLPVMWGAVPSNFVWPWSKPWSKNSVVVLMCLLIRVRGVWQGLL
jgi:phenylpyruvate tautomerase